jgi:hypothetical protein
MSISFRPHLRYLGYVLRHKWFVFLEACRLGIPLLGLVHDLDKFLPSMWFPYVEVFYGGKKPSPRDASGYYDASRVEAQPFIRAWLGHLHRNAHHWQHWVLLHDDGGQSVLPMPDCFRREMLADWRGAGRAQGKPDTLAWYQRNKKKMRLHPETRAWIEGMIGFVYETAEVTGMPERFPILLSPSEARAHPDWPRSVPWSLVAPHAAQAERNHSQTLTRLAERGGLGTQELVAVLRDVFWRETVTMSAEAAMAEVLERERDFMRPRRRRRLAIDFDGVLHAYSKGWQGGAIYDDPLPGAKAALDELAQRFDLVIFTARVDHEAVRTWLREKLGLPYLEVTSVKPAAWAYVDDRGITFRSWPECLDEIARLERTNERGEA